MLYFGVVVLFTFALVQVNAYNPPGVQCGRVVCLNETGVTCQNGKCKCDEGLYGNGRFACVDKSSLCVCYLFGDPHVTSFSEAVMSGLLPCQHTLAEFTTPSGINVKVNALGQETKGNSPPGYVVENEILFRATKDNTIAHADIRRTGFYNKGLKVNVPIATNFPDFGLACLGEKWSHYWRLEIPNEGVVLRYRSADSSATIQAPVGSFFNSKRMCGSCEDPSNTFSNDAAALGLTLREWSFYKTVLNLDPEDEESQTCKDMNTAALACQEDQLIPALKFCGSPYTNTDIGFCFVEDMSKDEIFSKTVECVVDFCSGRVEDACTQIQGVITRCSSPPPVTLSVDEVCQNLNQEQVAV